MNSYIEEFGGLLDKQATLKSKQWWEKYMKNVTPFRGVGIPAIRSQLKKYYKEKNINTWPVEKQFDLALSFFENKFAEDKLTGILFIELYLLDKLDYMISVPRYKKLFTDNHISDWNICDWFCVRVLGPTIKKSENACAKWISGWRGLDNPWLARASVVAFVDLAGDDEYYPLIKKSAEMLIRREERFRKTAVGWILREISVHDHIFIRDFLKDNLQFFTTESLRNTIKYFDKDEKAQWLRSFKAQNIKV